MEMCAMSDDNYIWSLTYEATPSPFSPRSVDLQFSMKKSQRVRFQNKSGIISTIIEYPQESSTLSIKLYVIEDPLSLEHEITKALEHFSVFNTSLWLKIADPIIGFVYEFLDSYGAASALAIDLELLIENTVREGETCAICLDGLCDRVGLARPPCKHAFHYSCLMSWLPLNNSCPLCRQRVFVDTDNYNDDDVESPE